MYNHKIKNFLEKLDELSETSGQKVLIESVRAAFISLFGNGNNGLTESVGLRSVPLLEMAMEKDKYFSTAFSQFLNIRNNCAYFLLYDNNEWFGHWKHELYGFCAKLKIPSLKSGDKFEETKDAILVSPFGEDFCDVTSSKESVTAFFDDVFQSEDVLHDFDHDMGNEANSAAFFRIMSEFYGKFLIGWISVPDKHPKYDELDSAVERLLIGRKSEIV